MKIKVYLSTIITAMAMCYSCNQKKETGISFSKELKDQKKILKITNHTDTLVEIIDYVVSCSCTKIDIKKGTFIKPNSFQEYEYNVKEDSTYNDVIVDLSVRTNLNPGIFSYQIKN